MPSGTAPESQLATPAQMAEIRRLVQIIGRLFYEDGHILLLDQLVSIAAIPAEVLARRIGLQARDLGSLAAKLVEDRIVSVHRVQESREGPFQRPVARTYYFLDYQQFLDVTKWRMMAMRRDIDTRLRNGLDNKGYVCPRCKRSYSALEVAHLLDMMRNAFVCDVPGCGTELVDNEDAEDVRKSKDTLTRFNEQLGVVQLALRSVEGVALPPMDIHAWLAKHGAAPPWQHEAPRDDLAPAPGAPPPAAPKAPALRVELAGDTAKEALVQKQQRLEEEERQRAQNMLPSWHLASTVSGERTGLQSQAEAQRRLSEIDEAAKDAQPAQDAPADDVDCTWRGLHRLCTLRVARKERHRHTQLQARGGGVRRGGHKKEKSRHGRVYGPYYGRCTTSRGGRRRRDGRRDGRCHLTSSESRRPSWRRARCRLWRAVLNKRGGSALRGRGRRRALATIHGAEVARNRVPRRGDAFSLVFLARRRVLRGC